MDAPVIELKAVTVRRRESAGFFGFGAGRGTPALLDVSLQLYPGQSVGLIGESGAGKSTAALTITGYLRPDQGEVRFEGENLNRLPSHTRQTRTRRLQLLSQEAVDRFDRERTIGKLLAEELTQRDLADGAAQARQRLADACTAAELAPALLDRRPAGLSGGELQRAAIARLVALNPRVVALDEPVAGVDPQLRERLLTLLKKLQQERRFAYLYISHDLHQIRRMTRQVAVLYRGRVVEMGSTADVLDNPLHPHTRALVGSQQRRDADPEPGVQPPGCPFLPLCPLADGGRCRSELPRLREVAPQRQVACHLV